MQIPKDTLQPWIEKLRDTRLTRRELWRLFDINDSRCHHFRYRDSLSDKFFYSPSGILLRTDKGKRAGRWREYDFTGISEYSIRDEVYTPYLDYEPQPKERLWAPGSLAPRQLRKTFGVVGDIHEITDLSLRIANWKHPMTFEDFADWLDECFGTKKKKIITHSNPLLEF